MSTFRPVNTSLGPESYSQSSEDTLTPTTPRPSTAPSIQPQPISRMDDATTPTRATFNALANQRPLPAQPFHESIPQNIPREEHNLLNRGDSSSSHASKVSEDHEMGESDEGGEGGEEGSSGDSVNADGTSSKKKKSQRFYCTDYPPCHLSFTRSEHLARHIRKHTGERPFQCHCSRRFSRLDNLRQHAQTVHVNEEIPPESLAATGTRFQRQVRTDRVRTPGSRSRAATSGGQAPTGPNRGHQRNALSGSSISSVGTTFSAGDDTRRRPPPLQMAGTRFSQEFNGYQPDSPSQHQYRPHSPVNFSTPTSATFSMDQNSPRWGSNMQSPVMSHFRAATMYNGQRTPGRRLSVPSAQNPFQSPHGYGPPLSNMNSSNMGAFSPASMTMSPTSSTSGWTGRRDSMSSGADEAWRRRTWHPETHSGMAASRLQNVVTNSYYSNGPPPQVPVLPSNAPPLSSMRLPGIASFDPVPRSTTPIRRQPSPMRVDMVDTPSRLPMLQPHDQYHNRPSSRHWESGIERNSNRMDIQAPPNDTAESWASDTNRAMMAQSEQARVHTVVRFEESPYSARTQNHHYSAPPITPRQLRRQGWYHGPPAALGNIDPRIQRTSPADSSGSEAGVPGTPSSANVGVYDPSIVHSNGYVEGRHGVFISNPPVVPSNAPTGYPTFNPHNLSSVEQTYTYAAQHPNQDNTRNGHQGQLPNNSDKSMTKLDALVAVATSEENAAAVF